MESWTIVSTIAALIAAMGVVGTLFLYLYRRCQEIKGVYITITHIGSEIWITVQKTYYPSGIILSYGYRKKEENVTIAYDSYKQDINRCHQTFPMHFVAHARLNISNEKVNTDLIELVYVELSGEKFKKRKFFKRLNKT